MTKLILLLLSTLAVLRAQPTVSNIRIKTESLSHGSAQILFDTSTLLSISACGGAAGQACWRARVSTSSCSGGTGGSLFLVDYHAGNTLQYSMAINVTGLTAGTSYFACVEASSNGSTWSTGAEATFTTPALPAVHPALPIAPVAYTIPALPSIGGGGCGSGSGECQVTAGTCGNYQSQVTAAAFGDSVTIPAGTTCTAALQLPDAPDRKSFVIQTSGTSTSTIHSVTHGLSEQQGVKLASTGCLPGTIVPTYPNPSAVFTCNISGGLIPGYVYYAKNVSTDDFQVSLTPGGAVYNFGYVKFIATVSGSTITIQPGDYEQAYRQFSPSGTADFGTTTAFQLTTTGTLPAGLALNTDYFLKQDCSNVIKCVTQVATSSGGTAVTITDTGTGTHTITTKGTGTHYFAPWPPANPNSYVVIRTASTAIPPDNVRTSPLYSPTMATLQQNAFFLGGTGATLIKTGILTHNYRFVGLDITTNQTAASELSTTVDPRPYGNLIFLGQDSGNIIFDRNRIRGRGYPDRLGSTAITWNGLNTAFVNNHFQDLSFWHPVVTSGWTVQGTTSSSVTLTSGSGYGSRTLHPVTTSTTVVNITNGAGASGYCYMYFDMSSVLQIRVPLGVTGNCSVTGVSCNISAVSDTSIQNDANGRAGGMKIARFLLTSGSVTAAETLDPYTSSLDAYDGSQTIIAGVGPGPYLFQNNYVSGTGITLHYDDGGGRYTRAQDVTVRRNLFDVPDSQRQGSATSDGLRYGHRQPLEFKTCTRCLVEGNEFTGSFMEVTRSSHTLEITPRNGGFVSDMDISNNLFHDTIGGVSLTGAIEGLPPVSYPLVRLRLANNLLYNIDGGVAHQATVAATFDGTGWQTTPGFGREDYTIEHNTFYNFAGIKPSFMDISWNTQEGLSATNNIIWIGSNTTGITFAGGEEPPGCAGLTGTLALDCAFKPTYTFSNVLIPAGANTENNLESIYAGRATTAQVPTNAAAVGFANVAQKNFRLAATSTFKAGGHIATDGLDNGIDQDTLEDKLGLIKNVRALSVTSSGASINFHAPDSGTSCYVSYSTSGAFNPTTWTTPAANTQASQERTIVLSGLTTKTAYFYLVSCSGTTSTVIQNIRTL